MGMEATSLSRILKNIEERGYIQRKPNPNDGRGVLIHLTALGLEKREESKGVVLRFNDVVKEHIAVEDLVGFFNVMEVINKLISDKKVYIKTTN
jgi:DNA-binding MarR family transcriptional regulator